MDLCQQVMSLLFNMLSRFVIASLPRSKHLLISWLQSPSAVILEPKKIKSAIVSIFFPYLFAMIFAFWMLIFKPFFSPSSFIFIKKLFSSSLFFCYAYWRIHIEMQILFQFEYIRKRWMYRKKKRSSQKISKESQWWKFIMMRSNQQEACKEKAKKKHIKCRALEVEQRKYFTVKEMICKSNAEAGSSEMRMRIDHQI